MGGGLASLLEYSLRDDKYLSDDPKLVPCTFKTPNHKRGQFFRWILKYFTIYGNTVEGKGRTKSASHTI